MRALALRAANTPFELIDVSDPVAGPGEAVARVLACGSGLTIQHYKAGRTPIAFPRTIGHEITGKIVAIGAGVTSLKVGDPVTAYYYLNCGHCRYCLSNLEPLCDKLNGLVDKECDGGYTPRDFDISPYFAAVKPTIEVGFDYQKINRSPDPVPPSFLDQTM